MTLSTEPFGQTADGQTVSLFTLKNNKGVTAKLTNYGARIVAVETPDRDGKTANVTLGFGTLSGYEGHKAFFACTTGRYANRIAGGKFTLDGQEYSLATNNGPNHLHGGLVGFDRKVWDARPVELKGAAGVEFSYVSPGGEEGYPGRLTTTVRYLLNDRNELSIEYEATTDAPTVLNLTNHAYWNLGGGGSGKILDHELTIAADQYLPTDTTSIPTGQPAAVAGTVMDFTQPVAIGARIDELKQDPEGTKGYDHCYVLRNQDLKTVALAARVKDPKTGRVLEVLTTEPGVQFYTGNFLDGDAANGGYQQHDAFCLETQHYPDSPNQPQFPSTVLRPGEKFHSITVHRFSAEMQK